MPDCELASAHCEVTSDRCDLTSCRCVFASADCEGFGRAGGGTKRGRALFTPEELHPRKRPRLPRLTREVQPVEIGTVQDLLPLLRAHGDAARLQEPEKGHGHPLGHPCAPSTPASRLRSAGLPLAASASTRIGSRLLVKEAVKEAAQKRPRPGIWRGVTVNSSVWSLFEARDYPSPDNVSPRGALMLPKSVSFRPGRRQRSGTGPGPKPALIWPYRHVPKVLRVAGKGGESSRPRHPRDPGIAKRSRPARRDEIYEREVLPHLTSDDEKIHARIHIETGDYEIDRDRDSGLGSALRPETGRAGLVSAGSVRRRSPVRTALQDAPA